jgi:spermidine/putrescine ABC transporter ATP-binding subunit
MEAAAVELEGVTKSLGGHRAVDGVSLRIGRGEFFTLLGPSGCGKTTTLRMVAGFEEPDAGRVLLGGLDVSGVPPYRRDANLVFQSYALFPHLSVERNVAFGLDVAGVPAAESAERVREALALVRMEGLGTRRPDELSGGQQQRVALARALVRRPSVLLLDEPLGALDLRLRKEMQGELRRLQRRLGTTFVHVTHDQEEALALSDRLAVMDGGRVAQVGTPEEVYERPATAFVARFLGDANVLPGVVRASEGGAATIDLDGGAAIQVWGAAGRAAGARVGVVVRPERIDLARDRGRDDARGALTGTVEDVTFAGADVRVVARLRGGTLLTVRRPADVAPRPVVGDVARFRVPPEAVTLVDAEEGP